MENQLKQTDIIPTAPADEQLVRALINQKKAFIEAKRAYCLTDFWEFSKEVIGWKDLDEQLHKPLCDFMQHQDKKRLVLLPRGHLKSSVVTVGYALWRIAQNPKIRILIANATGPLAITFLKQIKDHLSKNEKFIELFGDLATGATQWAEDAITIARPESFEQKESTVTAYGIGGSLTSQHYDVVLLDDLVNRENIHTADRINDVIQFYKDVMDLRDNVDTSEVILIGTRWHEGDLYGWIMDEENPARHEFLIHARTAVEGDYQITKNPTSGRFEIEGGEIIFPKKFTRRGLEKLIDDKGLSDFSSQYLNDPVPSADATFKHEFKYYEVEDIKGIERRTFITLDPAFFDPHGKSLETDPAAFVVVDVDVQNSWYIRDIIRKRMTPNEILNLFFELDTLWKPVTFGVESTAMQKILGYRLKEMMKERGHAIPITELSHAGANAKSKAERIQALEPRYAVGTIFHNKNIRHMGTLEMELKRFPRSKTDDVADALASMLEIATKPRQRNERSRGHVPNYPA